MVLELRKPRYQRKIIKNLKIKIPNVAIIKRYRISRCKFVKLRLSSQRQFFKQRFDGGRNNQHFLTTVELFAKNKCKSDNDIILCGNDNVVNHQNEIANICNDYLFALVDEIGFDGPIPPGYFNQHTETEIKIAVISQTTFWNALSWIKM